MDTLRESKTWTLDFVDLDSGNVPIGNSTSALRRGTLTVCHSRSALARLFQMDETTRQRRRLHEGGIIEPPLDARDATNALRRELGEESGRHINVLPRAGVASIGDSGLVALAVELSMVIFWPHLGLSLGLAPLAIMGTARATI